MYQPECNLVYQYDASGAIIGFTYYPYSGTASQYFFGKNLQGDVIRIINANGVTVVEYNYDAWGNILSVTGSMASTLGAANPFRYRGYYYDTESGWYYLNSRYYDPQVGRFINADKYVSTGYGLLESNMFVYCLDNPINRTDAMGTDSVRETAEDDDNPLNDMGYISPGGGGAGGGTTGASSRSGGGGSGHTQSGTQATVSVEEFDAIAREAGKTANQAIPGKGHVVGSLKHSLFKRILKRFGFSNIELEVSYKDGVTCSYGTKGSVRFDVVMYDSNGKILCAWDFKTGSAYLSTARTQHLQAVADYYGEIRTIY